MPAYTYAVQRSCMEQLTRILRSDGKAGGKRFTKKHIENTTGTAKDLSKKTPRAPSN